MEVEAVVTRAPRDVEAVRTEDVVFALMTEARDVEAVLTVLLVLALIAVCEEVIDEAKEVEADWMSESVAREPESRFEPVKVLVPLFQTSATKVPNEVSVLVVLVQIELAIVVVETIVAPTINVLSCLTKSPFTTLPHFIKAGQTPSGPTDGIE
jgi:hypothetical protein